MKKPTPWNWKTYIDEKETFFETEKGGRILRIRVHLRKPEKGNILWYLSTKSKSGHWSKFYLKLEEMEELGFLFLVLSKFCRETMSMDKKSFAKILNLKKVWENLQANPRSE